MKVPIEWLNLYFSKPLTTIEVADALELAGFEVDEIVKAPHIDPKIVVGRVKSVTTHPNADKLRLVEVSVKSTTLKIVCGAPNVEVGQLVPVALVGSKLPDGSVIKKATIRGSESHGMICSQAELGLGDESSEIMILPENLGTSEKIQSIVSESDVIDTTSASNRSDLNGLIWVAHEVAAHSRKTMKPEVARNILSRSDAKPARKGLDVKVSVPELANRYMLAHLTVDASKPSPFWLQQRLQAIGTRSINVVVDITNYVMFEYSQPLHAFDAAKVKLPISVRKAEGGESLVTLDGNRQKLANSDLLIADARGPIGLAGVMGGKESEIESNTSEIYLESANFDGPTLRRTALRHGLRSDASARFERGLPWELPPLALARAIELLEELAGAKLIAGPVDQISKPPSKTTVVVEAQRISSLLGINLSPDRIKTELSRLNFRVEDDSSGLSVTPPWWRPDIAHEADIAEEVIKLVGYDQLPATLPAWAPKEVIFDRRWPALWQSKSVLRSLELFEVVTYSFISEAQITDLNRSTKSYLKLKNPLSIEQAFLRTDLLPSLLKVAIDNRSYGSRFGVFEFSKVYAPRGKAQLPNEPYRLAVLVRSPSRAYQQAKAALDRLARVHNVEVKTTPGSTGPTTHPTRSAQLKIGNGVVGWIGQIHPSLVAASKLGGELAYLEIDWQAFVDSARPKQFDELSRYPAVTRDLSVVVARDVSWQEVSDVLEKHKYRAAFLNDYYGSDLGEGRKALALRITFESKERTLTDDEVDDRLTEASRLLARIFKAKLRD